jgi:hypothetical protein
VKLHARLNQNAAVPTVASPSNLVAVGRKLDRIHNYEAKFLEEDNQAIAVAPTDEGDQYGVSCRCYGRFALGQWVRFAQKIL